MRAMVLDAARTPLRLDERMEIPQPDAHEVLLHVHACGVCRTDLHVVDGELTHPKLPLVPGHEIVGTVTSIGSDVREIKVGDRVGGPWLGWTCGQCAYCRKGREYLCAHAVFPGYHNGRGSGEFTLRTERFSFPHPTALCAIEPA